MNIQNDCHKFMENILGCRTDFTIEDAIEILQELLKEFSHDKKKTDLIRKYLEDLRFLHSDNVEIYRQNREKVFYSSIKVDNKTRFSNPVLNDKLSPTIHAYYYCDKSRQVLSDKEAAALKAMNIDNNFEIIDEECLLGGGKFNRGKNEYKDFDQDSNGSNSNSNQPLSLYTSSFLEKSDNQSYLKKKRKYSMKMNSANKRGYKKNTKSSNKQQGNIYDYSEDAKNNFYSEDNEDEDKEYCIPACLLGRKYQEANDLMIECESCKNWYHPKCVKMTDEEFEIVKNTEWLCADCKMSGK